jgi:translation initiation factor IF-2
LFGQDITAKANDDLDADTAELVVEEFGHRAKRVAEADVEEAIDGRQDKSDELKIRAPVVTIMGHVDHGKTSLLDALRKTSVVDGEAGGITQHIGAYQTELKDERKITFIDTPGHAAFTAMRARGAKTTDIVVLVIAADDSVMPQTIESINHAKAAETPIIVALNKTDLESADPNKIMQQLLQYEVICEPLGGEVQVVNISAKTGEGLEQLSEAIVLQADMMELKANPDRSAQGVVIEARLDKGEGHVATILVQRGTLRQGDVFIAGSETGKVRRLKSFDGKNLKEAPPSCPVWVIGLSAPVLAGDSFDCVGSEARAREIAAYRVRQRLAQTTKAEEEKSIEQIFSDDKKKPELYYIVKTDVQGSADAIKQALEKISNEDINIRVSHAGVGEVNNSDVMLAQTLNAKILMFNAKASSEAQKMAKAAKIVLHQFDIIYALIDEVKIQTAKALGPERKETPLGSAEILELFSVGKRNTAAGCRINEGRIKKDAHIRIKRENVIVHEGMIQSLRHFKDNVAQIEAGKECGIVLESSPKLFAGDIIECFNVEQIERSIE